MKLSDLVSLFHQTVDLPIEIPEIRDALIKLGVQEEIIITGEQADPGKCRGVYYQYTTRSGLYGEPSRVTLIVYNSNLPVDWQRTVAGKELIHLIDKEVEKTKTVEDFNGLLDKLLGPLSSEDLGLDDLMAAIDKIAVYRALLFLFPMTARQHAIEELKSGRVTLEQIADWVCLPIPLVKLVMSEKWGELSDVICACYDD